MTALYRAILTAGVFALTAGSAVAATDAAACFHGSQMQGWKSPDPHTLYVRVSPHRVYRLDLAARCSMLSSVDVHLVTKFQGSDLVCRPIDWDLKVADSNGAVQGCIVKTMTLLTPAEADALPKKARP